MRKQKTATIGGFTYEISQFGAGEGRVLAVSFLRLFGKLAPMLASASNAEEGSANRIQSFSAALSVIEPNELEPFWEAFAKHTQVRSKDGKGREALHEVFDEHFAGRYFEMSQFFVEAATLNFGDFLGKILAPASTENTDQTP